MSGSPQPSTTAVQRALSRYGPLAEDELVDALVADGVDLGPHPADTLMDLIEADPGPVMPLIDDRWVHLPTLFDGRILTHRLSAPEAEFDLIDVGPDLFPVTLLTDNPAYQQLVDGSPLMDVSPLDEALRVRGIPITAVGEQGALLFPPGTFAALGSAAGDLVGLRVDARGFDLVAVGAPDSSSAIVDRISALLDEHPDDPELLHDAVWAAIAADDSLLRRPTAPLGELLAAGGLATHLDQVARNDFDFDSWSTQGRVELMTERYDLSQDEALAVLAMVRLCEQTRDLMDTVAAAELDSDDPEAIWKQLPEQLTDSANDGAEKDADEDLDRRAVSYSVGFLAVPAVALAVLSEIQDDPRIGAATMGLFAESMEPQAPREARPALRWLRANALEALGEVEEAERCYREAESLDPDWPLTVYSLAGFASDRGDAVGGLALLRRAGAPPDDDLVQLLEAFRPKPRPGLGRNQPCWCGSGRKYKVCHLNREQLPLEERAAWLYQKAGLFLADGGFTELLLDTAQERSRHWDGEDALFQALNDPFTTDAVLFEGGAFEEFLDVRGVLLPDDERLLAQQWLLLDRSVHEVVSVQPGAGITMRDVRTGDVHQVQERTASRQVRSGTFYCCRIVPAGETMQIFGGLEPVSIGERELLIELLDSEPDPDELVAFLSARFAPPTLQNTEGEPSVMCEARLRTDDPAALADRLDETFRRSTDIDDADQVSDAEEGISSWVELVKTDGLDRIRAHLDMTGELVRVQANSETRFDRVLDTLRSLDPGIRIVGETREPAGDLRAIQRLAEQNPELPTMSLDPAQNPAVAEALAQVTRTYEVSWLDEHIPALGGRTPRECADDPTRRDDLIRLLDSFPEADGNPGAMSPARLREALGLPPRG